MVYYFLLVYYKFLKNNFDTNVEGCLNFTKNAIFFALFIQNAISQTLRNIYTYKMRSKYIIRLPSTIFRFYSNRHTKPETLKYSQTGPKQIGHYYIYRNTQRNIRIFQFRTMSCVTYTADTLALNLNEISNSKLHIQLRHRNVTICTHRSDRSHSMTVISHLVEHGRGHFNLFRGIVGSCEFAHSILTGVLIYG